MIAKAPLAKNTINLFNQELSMKNPSTQKLKRKSFLKTTNRQPQHFQPTSKPKPLAIKETNIPTLAIDLSSNYKRPASIESIQKCRNELSQQKKMLLKELEKKEEKMEKLRLTFRKIQTSKPNPLILTAIEHMTHFRDSQKKAQSTKGKNEFQQRLTAYSPSVRYSRNQKFL